MAKSENKMNTIISELQNASKMHLRQSKELADHVKDMESGPLKHTNPKAHSHYKDEQNPDGQTPQTIPVGMEESGALKKLSCWKGYKAKGKKKSPSGKKTKGGKIKMVNNCVKK